MLEIGNTFDERLEIRNNSNNTKYWFEIIDRSDLLNKINSRVVTGLGAKKINVFQSTAVLNKRGFFTLGPTEVVSGDPFGFFTTSKVFQSKNHLLVYPKVYKLIKFPLLPAELTGNASLMTQTTHPTPQAAGVRDYSPGDPLSRVHWLTTVRRDKMMVKEFDEDSQSSIWLMLDAQKDKYFREMLEVEPVFDRNYLSIRKTKEYTLERDSFEYAVSITASIAKYFLEKNLAVGFACSSEKVTLLPPEKGHRQLNKFYEILANVCDIGTTPLEQLVEKQIKNIGKGSTIIIITASKGKSHEILMEILRRKSFRVLTVYIENESFIQNIKKPKGSIINPADSEIKFSFGDDISKVLSIL